MCFSTKASFGAAIVLTGIGIVALSKSRSGTQRAVALMPLLFAAQQCSEGILWISLVHPEYGYLKRWAMYLFLFFAEIVWPVFVPLITLLAERNADKRRRIGGLLMVGCCIVVSLIAGMIVYPVDARLEDGHILYSVAFPLVNTWYYGLIYFIPTIGAPLLSSNKWFRILGVSLFFAYLGSRILYSHFVISIWCYFGAMLSVIAIAMIRELATEAQPEYIASKARNNLKA